MALISRVTLDRHFALVDHSVDARAKGVALEDLLAYVLGKVPGVRVTHRNTVNESRSAEIDIGAWNDKSPRGLHFLNQFILVECKNWGVPVDSATVNWFDTKVRRRGLDFGLLVAASGVTGNASDLTSAHRIIADALADGRKLVVVTLDDLRSLTDTDDFVEVVKLKLCQLAFSGTTID